MIRLANKNDIENIMNIYAKARAYMKESGNPNQWKDGYPSLGIIENDILKQQLFVIEINNHIEFVFTCSGSGEPTYSNIDGKWLNDEPYAVIHRVASNMEVNHLTHIMFDYIKERYDNIRIDTHNDNVKMQKVLTYNNFVKTGIITLQDGNPRIAYQWCRNL